MSSLSNATLLITGGTGTFGRAALRHFLPCDLAQIRIFSSDEEKQDDMRQMLQAEYPQYASWVRFYIGDVRVHRPVEDAISNVDYVFYAAALKQVPSCEFFLMQAYQTNVEGTNISRIQTCSMSIKLSLDTMAGCS